MVASEIKWSGKLDEVDFLGRLYDLSAMPSDDYRFKTAKGDIRTHRGFGDWDNDWVFTDHRFLLDKAPDEELLRFLCETVHPVVRDPNEARALVAEYNGLLKADNWQLVETRNISGKPVYGAKRIRGRAEVISEPTGWTKVDSEVGEVKLRLESASSGGDFQAVGLLCREVLISLAQATYDAERYPTTDGVEPSDTDAGRMLEAMFGAELSGGANDQARKYAKAALNLAVALQHKRTADYRMAALCAEATLSVVNLCAILADRR